MMDENLNERCIHCLVRGVQGKTYHKETTCRLYPYTGEDDYMRGKYDTCYSVQLVGLCKYEERPEKSVPKSSERYKIKHR